MSIFIIINSNVDKKKSRKNYILEQKKYLFLFWILCIYFVSI